MSNRILRAIRGNLVAWLALFVALGGTSFAASHYVINSTRQINPKVLRKLEGRASGAGLAGPTGPAGSQGPKGAEGAKGAQGARGPEGAEGLEGLEGPEGRSALSSLPSGQTESGDFGIRITPNANASGQIDDSVTFPSHWQLGSRPRISQSRRRARRSRIVRVRDMPNADISASTPPRGLGSPDPPCSTWRKRLRKPEVAASDSTWRSRSRLPTRTTSAPTALRRRKPIEEGGRTGGLDARACAHAPLPCWLRLAR